MKEKIKIVKKNDCIYLIYASLPISWLVNITFLWSFMFLSARTITTASQSGFAAIKMALRITSNLSLIFTS